MRRLAWVLDESIRLPGGYRIGWDGLIGLVPGVGDLVGSALSLAILAAAAQRGAPPSVLLRMGGNVALEALVGTIPVLGDLFDLAYRANARNVRLFDEHARNPSRSRARSRLVVGAVLAGIALVLLAIAAGSFLVLRAAWTWISG